MKVSSLRQCIDVLEKQGELVTIREPVDPNLEMAEITRAVFNAKGPALWFTQVKNSQFSAISNLFGTWERTQKIFEPQLASVKALVEIKSDPSELVTSPGKIFQALPAALHALPLPTSRPKVLENKCDIRDLPMIKCWPGDGGAFILLPQVFSKDP
ncbi:MAG: UbiD family decarboxylase, partial [Desulfobacula sp.]|nr:UbiD family decarboxylase [Desulfobacula sp.]